MNRFLIISLLAVLPTLAVAQTRWVSPEEVAEPSENRVVETNSPDANLPKEESVDPKHRRYQNGYGSGRYGHQGYVEPYDRGYRGGYGDYRDRRYDRQRPILVREQVCERVYVQNDGYRGYDRQYGGYGYGHSYRDQHQTGRTLAGAALGAAVGRQFGDGSGQDAATVIGALAGAHLAQRSDRHRDHRPVQRGYWTTECYWTWVQR